MASFLDFFCPVFVGKVVLHELIIFELLSNFGLKNPLAFALPRIFSTRQLDDHKLGLPFLQGSFLHVPVNRD